MAKPSARGFGVLIAGESRLTLGIYQLDLGQKRIVKLTEPDALVEAVARMIQGEAIAHVRGGVPYNRLTFSCIHDGPELSGVGLRVRDYDRSDHVGTMDFGPWGDTICRTIAFALREAVDQGKAFDRAGVDALCAQLGGDFELPLHEMPQSTRRSYRFELLRSYCSAQASGSWTNWYGWGWRGEHYSSSGTKMVTAVRYYPSFGLVHIAEQHGHRWQRPYALYYPDEEAEAIAHLRALT